MPAEYDIDWAHVNECIKPVAGCPMCSVAFALQTHDDAVREDEMRRLIRKESSHAA